VDQRIRLLVLLDVLLHGLDALGERPSFHLGLVVHVGDLLFQRVSVHFEIQLGGRLGEESRG